MRGNGAGTGNFFYKAAKASVVTPTIYSTVTGTARYARNLNTATDQAVSTGGTSEFGAYAYPSGASVSDVYLFQWDANAEL